MVSNMNNNYSLFDNFFLFLWGGSVDPLTSNIPAHHCYKNKYVFKFFYEIYFLIVTNYIQDRGKCENIQFILKHNMYSKLIKLKSSLQISIYENSYRHPPPHFFQNKKLGCGSGCGSQF